MSKSKIKYVCSNCGYESLKWIGKCPSCDNWNTFIEEIVEEKKSTHKKIPTASFISKLNASIEEKESRINTNIEEFDRVLGGGLMPGSVILIGGDPGIGKSTLVLQAASKIKDKVLYVTGEESIRQINMRAKRLKVESENIFIMTETDLDIIISTIGNENPQVVIIDSIQTN